jgi:hypothetical protein
MTATIIHRDRERRYPSFDSAAAAAANIVRIERRGARWAAELARAAATVEQVYGLEDNE